MIRLLYQEYFIWELTWMLLPICFLHYCTTTVITLAWSRFPSQFFLPDSSNPTWYKKLTTLKRVCCILCILPLFYLTTSLFFFHLCFISGDPRADASTTRHKTLPKRPERRHQNVVAVVVSTCIVVFLWARSHHVYIIIVRNKRRQCHISEN